MSATNRGSERRANDFYETPETVTRDFLLNHFEGNFHTILEPCAGSGKMTKVLKERYPDSHITGIDIAPERFPEGANVGIAMDFLEFPEDFGQNNKEFDLIFTNPPYSLAKEIITHAMERWPKATIVMLLRGGFLESKDRHFWWQDKLPTELYILSKRPSFTGKGTDSALYAWYVWRPGVREQKIRVIWGDEHDADYDKRMQRFYAEVAGKST